MDDARNRTKLVVRRLPPSLTEDAFRKALGEWLLNIEWMHYVPGNDKKPFMGDARAYIKVKEPDGVVGLKRFLTTECEVLGDGSKGQSVERDGEYPQVMFAPCQRVRASVGKVNALENTIESDQHYLDFCKELEAREQGEGADVKENPAITKDAEVVETDTKTPLMEFLEKRHQEIKMSQKKKKPVQRKSQPPSAKQQQSSQSSGEKKGQKKNKQGHDKKNKGSNNIEKKDAGSVPKDGSKPQQDGQQQAGKVRPPPGLKKQSRNRNKPAPSKDDGVANRSKPKVLSRRPPQQ